MWPYEPRIQTLKEVTIKVRKATSDQPSDWVCFVHLLRYVFLEPKFWVYGNSKICFFKQLCVCMISSVLPTVRTWHLSVLKWSNHLSDQFWSSWTSFCSSILSSLDMMQRRILVSSANMRVFEFILSGRSLMKITNSNSPNTLSCGIPLRTGVVKDLNFSPLTLTSWERFRRNASNHFKVLPVRLEFSN